MKKLVLSLIASTWFAGVVPAAIAGPLPVSGADLAGVHINGPGPSLHNDIIRMMRGESSPYKPGDMEGRVATAEDPATIRVMFNYSPAALALMPDMEFRVQNLITQVNEGYAASGVFVKLELAHISQMDFVETDPSSKEALDADLEAYMVPNDGKLDDIHALRDQYKADVSAMVVQTSTVCGGAPNVGSDATTAFIVLNAQCLNDSLALAHEIGHLQGATHDMDSSGGQYLYTFGYGYQQKAYGWRTIMAYECEANLCPWINRWSNPDLIYNGAAGGTVEMHDNRRVLNLTSHYIAGYR